MKFLAHVFFFFCFFPYINVINLGTDTQPNALVLGSIMLFTLNKKKINLPIILLWVLFGLSILLYFKSSVNFFDYLKNCFNYLSLPLTCMATYAIYNHYDYKLSFKHFVWILCVYGLIGFVQSYFYEDFMTFLLTESGRGVGIGGRGAISLTPEPAFYGTLCLFFMIFSILTYNRKQNKIVALILLIQIFIFAKSSTALLILIVSLLLFVVIQFLRFKMKYVLITGLALLILVPVGRNVISQMEETRMGEIATEFIENPLLITHLDVSVGTRVTGAVSPFFAFKHNYMLPMGIGYYKAFLKDLYINGHYRSILTGQIINQKDRLGGSMNMVLFQLGFLGLLLPIAILLSFKGYMTKDGQLFALILFMCILFTQIQMMHSMIGMILGTAMFYTRKEKNITLNRTTGA